jgi:hypothetical protein
MSDLPLEKQLTHAQFCKQVADIRDRNVLIKMLEDLHLKYLSDQAMVSKIAKNEFMGDKKECN